MQGLETCLNSHKAGIVYVAQTKNISKYVWENVFYLK